MSLDLTVPAALTSLQKVQDQDDNPSPLYMSNAIVAVATESPDTDASLTAYAPSNQVAITTQRPGNSSGSRTHFKAQSIDSSGAQTEVWRMMTNEDGRYGFVLRVNETNRLTIDQDGNMTLNVASLKITGLPSGASGSALVIDSDGNVGIQ